FVVLGWIDARGGTRPKGVVTMGFFARFLARAHVRSCHSRLSREQLRCVPRIELLESRLVPDATAVANAEHIAAFGVADANGVVTGGLVPDSALTVKSIASGSWSNPAIWSTGAVPHSLDNVLVTAST